MKKIGLLLGLLASLGTQAQYNITRALSFQMGLNQTLYKSEMPESRNFSSHFLPSFALDACTYGSNVFWVAWAWVYRPVICPCICIRMV